MLFNTYLNLDTDGNNFEKSIPAQIGKNAKLKQLILGEQIFVQKICPISFDFVPFALTFLHRFTYHLCFIEDKNLFTGSIPLELGNLSELDTFTFCKYDSQHTSAV